MPGPVAERQLRSIQSGSILDGMVAFHRYNQGVERRGPVKVKIEAGIRGWLKVKLKLQATDSVTFKRNMLVDAEPYGCFGIRRPDKLPVCPGIILAS